MSLGWRPRLAVVLRGHICTVNWWGFSGVFFACVAGVWTCRLFVAVVAVGCCPASATEWPSTFCSCHGIAPARRESSNLGCECVGCYSFACCNFLDKIISVGFRFSVLFSFGDLLGLVFLSVWIMEFCGDLWCRRPRFMICSNLSLVSRSSGFWNWDVCGEGIWLMGVCMCFRECVCFREMVIRGLSSLLWLRFPFQRERTKRKTDVGFYFLEDR